MADPRLFRLRVHFAMRGRLAMLSHLELCRALERAVRRAKLPYAVSQGFSPHMRIAFGAALPVGIGGTEEFFDLYLVEYLPPARALAALQAASPADLMPHEAKYVDNRADAASVAFPLSTYEARFAEPGLRLTVPETVTVVRKKKEKTLVVGDFLVGDVEYGATGTNGDAPAGTLVRFTLEAKPTGSLRPDVFLQACLDASAATNRPTSVTRIVQR